MTSRLCKNAGINTFSKVGQAKEVRDRLFSVSEEFTHRHIVAVNELVLHNKAPRVSHLLMYE